MPLVKSVFHPTDFSEGSEIAFAHALAFALLRETQFTLFHVGTRRLKEEEWTRFPPVRKVLERWGFLREGSPRSAVFEELAVRVNKITMSSYNPLAAVIRYLETHPADLIVLATHGREGFPRWIQSSIAERLARRSNTMTLFVPNTTSGFVALEDGAISLRRILIPVDHQPNPEAAFQFATRASEIVGKDNVEITLVHVGNDYDMNALALPEGPSWSWDRMHRSGLVTDEIIKSANEISADLIMIVTEGHQGILDAVRGSTTEQVLRQAPCPVLAVPAACVANVGENAT